ncbi:CRISPR-associated endoribonuclease Cas6 [Archaeoglobales archaeon]|nr:MAG: CRISPR-associated endoribonuclease Cas6 [Archaeoglobales archaeon]
MSDIVKVTIEFEALESKMFRMYSGAFVRGFVYWALSRMDRTFAEKLHSSKTLSPFSVTPVMSGDGNPVNKLEGGKEYSFSITFFVPEIGEALKNYLTSVDEIYFTAVQNPLKKVKVKYCDEELLMDKPINKFRVDFVSPCYFRTPSNNYRFIPLPLPNLMFRSLARLYSAFLSEIPQEYRNWLDRGGIAVSGLKIETQKVLLKKGKWAVGFCGYVNFSLPEDTYNDEWAEITSKLLNFGEYSNVGGSRTSGMGVIRRCELKKNGKDLDD